MIWLIWYICLGSPLAKPSLWVSPLNLSLGLPEITKSGVWQLMVSFQSNPFMDFLVMEVFYASTNLILKILCPKKINLFNWLAWDNSILTLDKLAERVVVDCQHHMYSLPCRYWIFKSSATPVSDSFAHLELFTQIFHLPEPPTDFKKHVGTVETPAL